MNDLTLRGINALKANDRASARKFLAAALQQDQNDASAWLWLAAAVDTPGQRIDCLRQVLKIDPNNQAAIKGLAALGATATPVDTAQPVVEKAEEQPPAPAEQQPIPGQSNAAPAFLPLDDLRAMAEASYADEPAEEQPEPVEPSERLQTQIVTEQASELPSASFTPPAAVAPVVSYSPPPRAGTSEENARKIFNVRPSNIPAVLAFWLFFFGSLFLGGQINALNPGGTFQEGPWEGMPFALFGMLFSLGLGLALTVVVMYVVLRNARTHYELTSASLTLPFRGKRARIPIHEIYSVDCRQSFFQKLYGAGDVLLDAAVKGELAHVRLRSVPGCHKRVEEIAYLMRDHNGPA